MKVRNKAMNSPQIYSPVQLANYLKLLRQQEPLDPGCAGQADRH